MLISATIYSVLCLFVTGLFDLVLKLYSNKGYSLGKLIFGVGLIWGVSAVGQHGVQQQITGF